MLLELAEKLIEKETYKLKVENCFIKLNVYGIMNINWKLPKMDNRNRAFYFLNSRIRLKSRNNLIWIIYIFPASRLNWKV